VTVTGFALQLIQTVVWPVTIVTLAVLLRRSLANLISRFQEGEFPGVKVRFTGESIQPGILSEVTFRAILYVKPVEATLPKRKGQTARCG
jgi:hypothetical protein